MDLQIIPLRFVLKKYENADILWEGKCFSPLKQNVYLVVKYSLY